MEGTIDALVALLREELDDALQGIISTVHDGELAHTVHHLRPDVADALDDGEPTAVAREAAIEQVIADDRYYLGDHGFTMATYEHGTVLWFTLPDDRSLVAAADPSADAGLLDVARRCRELVEDDVELRPHAH